jgi:hypothetical protein
MARRVTPQALLHWLAVACEGQPLVVDNTTCAVRPFPDNLLAIDLTKPDDALKVVCEPLPHLRAVGIACFGVVNRTARFADRRSPTACRTTKFSRRASGSGA